MRPKWMTRKSVLTGFFLSTFGVVHTHMVAGYLGGFLTGLFATEAGTKAFAASSAGGAIVDNGKQVWVSAVASG